VFLAVLMADQHCVILNWNVRGINNSARRKVVRDLVSDTRPTIVCLQESKLTSVTVQIIKETLGQDFVDHFAFLPAQGTRGGAILVVHANNYKIL
jgi:DNA phosphorothioation-dependent restriction protein DptG